jgi:hypothetical protein
MGMFHLDLGAAVTVAAIEFSIPYLYDTSLMSSSSLLSSEEEIYELSVSVLVLEALVDVSSWSSIWSAAAKTGSCALRWFNILCSSREWSVSCRYRGSEADVRCVGAARVDHRLGAWVVLPMR